MADMKKRGGQKSNKGQQPEARKHQGVHPESSTQDKQRDEMTHRRGHEKLVPDKGD